MSIAPHRPKLLVSVRNAREATDALDGGAQLIDIKEPSRGPLGRADDATVRDILDAVGDRAPVSAALGDVTDAAPMAFTLPVRFVKLGLAHAPADWNAQLVRHFNAAAPALPVIAAYADHARVAAPPPVAALQWAWTHGVAGLLIDTAVKDGSGLFDHMDEPTIIELLRAARAAGMLTALAGALHGAALERAAALGPDYIAVRGAVCVDGARGGRIDAQRVRALRRVMQGHTAAPSHHAG